MHSANEAVSVRQRLTSAAQYILFAVMAMTIVVVPSAIGQSARAITTVNTKVRDNQPASITIDGEAANVTTSSSPYIITGTVHNIGQIMVYVDGQHHTTIPLDFGANTYSLALILNPGTHDIRLVGIDSIAATQVQQSFVLTYDPLSPESQTEGDGSQANGLIPTASADDLKNAVNDSRQAVTERASALSQQGLFKPVIDGLYGFMLAADLVVPGQQSHIGVMFGRFICIILGLILVVFPQWSYRMVRKLPFVSVVDTESLQVNFIIRLIGVILIVIPFFVFR